MYDIRHRSWGSFGFSIAGVGTGMIFISIFYAYTHMKINLLCIIAIIAGIIIIRAGFKIAKWDERESAHMTRVDRKVDYTFRLITGDTDREVKDYSEIESAFKDFCENRKPWELKINPPIGGLTAWNCYCNPNDEYITEVTMTNGGEDPVWKHISDEPILYDLKCLKKIFVKKKKADLSLFTGNDTLQAKYMEELGIKSTTNQPVNKQQNEPMNETTNYSQSNPTNNSQNKEMSNPMNKARNKENDENIHCVDLNPHTITSLGFGIREKRNRCFLSLDTTPSKEQISGLLELLTEKEELFFWNYYHKSSTDPGSYVTVHVVDGKAIIKEANHGWSGNYHLISIDDLIELIIRNWDKDWDNQQEFKNAIAVERAIRPKDVLAQMKQDMDVFVPDYSVTAW